MAGRNANAIEDLPVAALLRRVRLAPRQESKGLTLWPLVLPAGAAGPTPGGLALLGDAMEDGFVGVGPVDRAGHCRVETRSPVPVLVLAGEAVGAAGVARQTRLLPARGRRRVQLGPAGERGVCPCCLAGVSGAFRRVPGQVGFAVAVHDRMAALELLLPAPGIAVSLRRRLRAWAPLLVAREALARPDGPAPGSPEAFLEAAAHLAGELLGQETPREASLAAAAVALGVSRAGPLVHVVGLTEGPAEGWLPFV